MRARPIINSKTTRLPISIAQWLSSGARLSIAQRSGRAAPHERRPRAILSLAVGLLLIACVSTACDSRTATPAGGLSVTDEIGRTVNIKPQPRRIVSLAPSITETLFALGLGGRVVGVTSYCDYPPESAQKEKVGDTQRPNIEKVVALSPDLVIASTASQLEQFVKNLDQVGIPVYVSNPRDLGGVLESINKIGEITGANEAARDLVSKLRERTKTVESHVAGAARPRVFLMLSSEPLITIGGDTFFNDLITRAGGLSISAAQSVDYPQYSLETAVAERPEVIFLQTGEARLPDRLKETPAGRAGRVFHIDDDLLLRPGPRIVDALEQMAAYVHPEVFRQTP